MEHSNHSFCHGHSRLMDEPPSTEKNKRAPPTTHPHHLTGVLRRQLQDQQKPIQHTYSAPIPPSEATGEPTAPNPAHPAHPNNIAKEINKVINLTFIINYRILWCEFVARTRPHRVTRDLALRKLNEKLVWQLTTRNTRIVPKATSIAIRFIMHASLSTKDVRASKMRVTSQPHMSTGIKTFFSP